MTKTEKKKFIELLRKRLPDTGVAEYKIGYGKPPIHTQFKKGQSGNPSGRPTGTKNKRHDPTTNQLHDLIQEEANREITVQEKGEDVSITMVRAIVRTMAVKAARGGTQAQTQFMRLTAESERSRVAQTRDELDCAIQYKLAWDAELRRRKKTGIQCRAPLPHPDDVHIDPTTCEIYLTGPLEKSHVSYWKWLAGRKSAFSQELEQLCEEYAECGDPKEQAFLKSCIANAEEILEIINMTMDDDNSFYVRTLAQEEEAKTNDDGTTAKTSMD